MRPWTLLATVSAVLAAAAAAQPVGDPAWDKATLEPLEREPRLTVAPRYPARALAERLEGRTIVCFRIRRDGTIQRPYVLTSTARVFEKPSMKAIKASSYRPDDDPAAPESIEACRTFRFLLTPDESPAGR